jgi:hypothetical protein
MRVFLVTLVLAFVASPAHAQDGRGRDSPADKAVDRALEYLYKSQDKNDGAWRLGGQKSPAPTALAVMAFLSVGHVPGEGKYGETVEKGIRWVIKQQSSRNGLIGGTHNHEMYHHGICTLMLAEAAGMVEGDLARDVRKALTAAVKLILQAQRTAADEYRGGWRYTVAHHGGSDMSLTGWQIMALRASKNVGCDVPPEAIDRAVEFIKRCQDPSTGGFAYVPNGGATIPCTGTGILALELCGNNLHRCPEALRAGAFLLKNPPVWGDGFFYYMIYYCTQATFQLGDNYWNFYGPKVKQVLLANQQANGSWDGGGSDGGYGPAYCTSMAVLALTVEYRFLPIYQREEPRDKKR